jgi:hypothetical protein
MCSTATFAFILESQPLIPPSHQLSLLNSIRVPAPDILSQSGGIYRMQGVRSLAGEVRNESPCAQVDDAFGTTLEDISSARDDRSTVFASTIWQSLYRKSKRVAQAFLARRTVRNA